MAENGDDRAELEQLARLTAEQLVTTSHIVDLFTKVAARAEAGLPRRNIDELWRLWHTELEERLNTYQPSQ